MGLEPPTNVSIVTADFNEFVDGGDLLLVGRDRVRGCIPTVGDRIYVEDREGHACWAEVKQVLERTMLLLLDYSTWRGVFMPDGFA